MFWLIRKKLSASYFCFKAGDLLFFYGLGHMGIYVVRATQPDDLDEVAGMR